MVERHGIDVRYGHRVTRIDRHLSDPDRPIVVRVAGGEAIECDHLVFAAPMHREFLRVVSDATDLEREVCGALSASSLVSCLLKTAKKADAAVEGQPGGEAAITYYPNALMPEFTDLQGVPRVYHERNSIRSVRPEMEATTPMRYTVAYQYIPVYDANACSAAVPNIISDITSKDWVVHAAPSDPAPQVLEAENWDWLALFSQAAVQQFLPWRLFEAQGVSRTWYIGSSCCMDSVEDVLQYNDFVLRRQLPDMETEMGPRHLLRSDA